MLKITLFIILISLLGFYLYNENTKLEINSHDIISEKIISDLKIVHISDFHNTKSKRLTHSIINEISKQKPDIIVITGDLIDSHRENISIAIDFVQKIREIAPIYYVCGNHEANIIDYNELKQKLIENDVTILENKTIIFEKKNFKINIVGIVDPFMPHNDTISDEEIIKSELQNIDFDENNFTILLSHRPESFEVYAEKNVDLVFAGHAHGGQIRVPFIGGLFAPNQGILPKLTSGIYSKNNTKMIISRGIGNSVFPFRVNNNPELVVVDLKKLP